MPFDSPQDSSARAPDPLLQAIRSRLRPMKAPEHLRARIAAMLAAELGAESRGEPGRRS